MEHIYLYTMLQPQWGFLEQVCSDKWIEKNRERRHENQCNYSVNKRRHYPSPTHHPSATLRAPRFRDRPPPAPCAQSSDCRNVIMSHIFFHPSPFRIPCFRSDPPSHRSTHEHCPHFSRFLFLHQRYSPGPDPATARASQTSPFVCFDEPLLVEPCGFDPSSLLAWIVFPASRLVLPRLRLERLYTHPKCCDCFCDWVYFALGAIPETTLCPPSQNEIITKIRSLH